MSTVASRISLGIAFLTKPKSSTATSKCIIHAEYLIDTRQYLLTKVNYTLVRSHTFDSRIVEVAFDDVAHILARLVRIVKNKFEDGYAFDTDALELLAEEDEQWGDFQLLGNTSETEGSTITHDSAPVLRLRTSRVADTIYRVTRRDKPTSIAQKIRMNLAQKHLHVPRMRAR